MWNGLARMRRKAPAEPFGVRSGRLKPGPAREPPGPRKKGTPLSAPLPRLKWDLDINYPRPHRETISIGPPIYKLSVRAGDRSMPRSTWVRAGRANIKISDHLLMT